MFPNAGHIPRLNAGPMPSPQMISRPGAASPMQYQQQRHMTQPPHPHFMMPMSPLQPVRQLPARSPLQMTRTAPVLVPTTMNNLNVLNANNLHNGTPVTHSNTSSRTGLPPRHSTTTTTSRAHANVSAHTQQIHRTTG